MARRSRPGRHLRKVEGEWVLGRRKAPALIDADVPHQPDVLLLVEAGSGFVFGSEIVEPDASDDVVAAWAEGKVEPGVTLRVEDERLAGALRARLGAGQPVRVGPIPEIRAPLAAVTRFMGRGGARRRDAPKWRDEASPAARTRFYEAAGRFENADPWACAGGGQILALDIPALGWEGACASILGAGGQEFGLLLFRSLHDYLAFARLSAPDRHGGRRSRGPAVPLLAVSYDHPDEVAGGRELERAARCLGWKPGKTGRLAYLLKIGAEDRTQTLATDDYRLATVALEAVGAFVGENRSLFDKPPKKAVEKRLRVATPAGDVEVRLSAPPADLPWGWGEEEPIDGLLQADTVDLREAFRKALREKGASEDEADHACQIADEALRYKAGRRQPPARWTADDVEEYLLDHYPERGGAPDEDLELVPRYLDALLEWLAASGRGEAGPLGTARARLARCREAFLRDTRDPKRFGLAKTVVRAMMQEGVDPTDRRATDRFLAKFNERLQEDPSLLPDLEDVPRRRRLWVWTAGQPPPDPKDPCPCGSGKRYRKCCMPR
jgi:hypothetical protein